MLKHEEERCNTGRCQGRRLTLAQRDTGSQEFRLPPEHIEPSDAQLHNVPACPNLCCFRSFFTLYSRSTNGRPKGYCLHSRYKSTLLGYQKVPGTTYLGCSSSGVSSWFLQSPALNASRSRICSKTL